jgi:NAD(P)-dependent dehydrogenase (short-subunit alcohol dehydrogenase family)
MARIFITGSNDGLGLGAARTLLDQGHEVVFHARNEQRAAAVQHLSPFDTVIGDLSSADETRSVADQVNKLGRMDAVIHNAGVYLEQQRGTTAEGHARTVAINVLAPYLLTALIERPDKLVYISSGLHREGSGPLDDVDWTSRRWNAERAYSESKLYVSALACAVARYWSDVPSNSVNPGWVPTKMSGPHASDDLVEGYLTQAWLAASNDPAAAISGGYWFHKQQQAPAPEVSDHDFQDQLLQVLADFTGTTLI